MKHPEPERWMAYLYEDGLDPGEHAELKTHLNSCADCRRQVESWNQVRQHLDAWKIPPSRRIVPFPRLRWAPLAAAAAILLAFGLALGRYALPHTPELKTVQGELRRQFQAEWSKEITRRLAEIREGERAELQQVLADYVGAQERLRRQDLATLLGAVQTLDNRQRKETAELRRDLETVAVLTDATFRRTQDQMVQLANSRSSTAPATVPDPLESTLREP